MMSNRDEKDFLKQMIGLSPAHPDVTHGEDYLHGNLVLDISILFLGDKTAAQLSGSKGMKRNNALQVVVILLSSAIFH